MQIIALFHYLWFILYKRLLSNTHNDLKCRHGKKFSNRSMKTELNVCTIKVNNEIKTTVNSENASLLPFSLEPCPPTWYLHKQDI